MDGSGTNTPFTLAAQPAAAALATGDAFVKVDGSTSEEGEAGDEGCVPGERPQARRLRRLLLAARQMQQR